MAMERPELLICRYRYIVILIESQYLLQTHCVAHSLSVRLIVSQYEIFTYFNDTLIV